MESPPPDRVQGSEESGSPPAADLPRGDRLTIRRLLILTAGVAISLGVYWPEVQQRRLADVEGWLMLSTAFLAGLALPAPLFTVRFRRGQPPLGPGGMFALASGLGALLLLLPVEINALNKGRAIAAPMCLAYCLPLMGTWYLLAASLGGRLGRQLFRPQTPWIERYGFLLAALATPWGLWHLVQMYLEAL